MKSYHLWQGWSSERITRSEVSPTECQKPRGFRKNKAVSWVGTCLFQRHPGPCLQNLWLCHLKVKRGFAGVVELRTLSWGDYPWLSSWVHCLHKDSDSRERKQRQWETWGWKRCHVRSQPIIAGFEDGESGALARELRDEEMDSPLERLKGTQPCPVTPVRRLPYTTVR